jgi:hypothetical protein
MRYRAEQTFGLCAFCHRNPLLHDPGMECAIGLRAPIHAHQKFTIASLVKYAAHSRAY